MPHRRKRTQSNIALDFYDFFFFFFNFPYSYMHSLIYCQSLMLVFFSSCFFTRVNNVHTNVNEYI